MTWTFLEKIKKQGIFFSSFAKVAWLNIVLLNKLEFKKIWRDKNL